MAEIRPCVRCGQPALWAYCRECEIDARIAFRPAERWVIGSLVCIGLGLVGWWMLGNL